MTDPFRTGWSSVDQPTTSTLSDAVGVAFALVVMVLGPVLGAGLVGG